MRAKRDSSSSEGFQAHKWRIPFFSYNKVMAFINFLENFRTKPVADLSEVHNITKDVFGELPKPRFAHAAASTTTDDKFSQVN